MIGKSGTVIVITEDTDCDPIMARIIDNVRESESQCGNCGGRYRAACFTQNKWVGPIRETYDEARNDRYIHAQPTGHTTHVVFLRCTKAIAQTS